MAQNNKVSIDFTTEKQTAVLTGISDIHTVLDPALKINLTPTERLEMPKMGDKSVSFVAKALELATNNPKLVPPYLDLEEAKKDFTLVERLLPIRQELDTLLRAVEDVMMVAGSEAYEASLIFYSSVKGAARTEVAGAQAVQEQLKVRFPRRSKRSTSPAE